MYEIYITDKVISESKVKDPKIRNLSKKTTFSAISRSYVNRAVTISSPYDHSYRKSKNCCQTCPANLKDHFNVISNNNITEPSNFLINNKLINFSETFLCKYN